MENFKYQGVTETNTNDIHEEIRVFVNKVLKKILGAKRDEITREWRKLHNVELHALYSSPNITRNFKTRRPRWAEYVARMEQSRNTQRILMGKPNGRPRRRWEDNIKTYLNDFLCVCV